MLRSPQVYAQLTDLLTKLRALLEDCRKDAENYDAFYAEYTRYQQLYMQFRAVMSADEASMEDKDGYLEEPAEIVFEFSDPEKQRQSLAERNRQLELLVHQAMQHGFCAGLSAVLGKSAWGKEFKSERLRDGSAHVTYVRKGDFGAIYDISYDAAGRVSMCPRGVILSNGRSLISPEALNGIYESCDWAKEISDAFSQIGLCDGACEEMPEEVRQQLGLGSPAENKENTTKLQNVSTAVKLTEPPKEGEVLANIQYADETGRLRYTSPYYTYGYGQCTWYAGGRFEEVHGIHISIHGCAKEWLDSSRWDASLEVVTDLSSVPEQSIAIYVPKTDNRLAGHVCFIEYVERDEKGNPLYIYYTDANGKKDTVKNAYTPGVDGMVIKEDYQTFLENSQLKLAGYLKVKE